MISLDAMPVPLKGGQYAWVDAQDHEACMRYKWFLDEDPRRRTFYARGGAGTLHRFVADRMGLTTDRHVDHKDRNGQNCTRENLRSATVSQNHANRTTNRNNTSGFKGVYLHSQNHNWTARICVNRKQKLLGCFADKETAARVYDQWAKAAWGEFALLNFPGDA